MDLFVALVYFRVRDTTRFRELIDHYCPGLPLSIHEIPDNVLDQLRVPLITDLKGGQSLALIEEIKGPDLSKVPGWLFHNQSSTNFRDQRTVNGYRFDTTKSAVQKYLRRGEGIKALLIGAEMDLSRWVSGAKGMVTNFTNRLRITYLEDIGIADPHLMVRVDHYLREWKTEEGLSPSLMRLLWEMAFTNHTRRYSHLNRWTAQHPCEEKDLSEREIPLIVRERPEIQRWAQHLIAGLESRSETESWFWASKIFRDEEKLLARYPTGKSNSGRPGFFLLALLEWWEENHRLSGDRILWRETLRLAREWYQTLDVKESFLLVLHPLQLYLNWNQVGEAISRSEPSVSFLEGYAETLLNQSHHFEDYVLDMHTQRGRHLGRHKAEFAANGSLVAFEDRRYHVPLWFDNYQRYNLSQGTVRKESEEFQFKVRAQLVTSEAKTDVYYATDWHDRPVVVKGPYLRYEKAKLTFDLQAVARLFPQVNSFEVGLKILKPDLFPETPIGLRKKTNPEQGFYFLVSEDLFSQEEYPVREHKSKLWPPTLVVDYETLFTDEEFGFARPSRLSPAGRLSMLYQLAWRWIFRVGDMAERNLVFVGDRVYNLDTEGYNINNRFRMKRAEQQYLVATYRAHRAEVTATLTEWRKVPWLLLERTLGDVSQFQEDLERLIVTMEGHLLLQASA